LHHFSMLLRSYIKRILTLLTLQSKSVSERKNVSISDVSISKRVVFHTYVIVNGLYFHIFGKQFAFPVHGKWYGKYESFQTESGIIKALENAGFRNPTIQRGKRQRGKIIFAVTAQNGS
jgi:hypothetical protein